MANNLARAFRNNPTSAEARAWRVLRKLRAEGVHVRRQHPIGRYITDFAVLTARLAIELDGGSHQLTIAEDAQRDRVFAQLGWRVLRLPNKFAFSPDHLIDAVRAALRECGAYPPREGRVDRSDASGGVG